MAADRLPWFKCNPGKLLGAMAGMGPDENLVYVTVLLRIYETGGPIMDRPAAIGRRCGLPERRVKVALENLVLDRKIQMEGDQIDSDTTHETLEEMSVVKKVASTAGKLSAQKRAEKNQQNQQNGSTPVERLLNGSSTIKNKNIDRDSDTESKQIDLLPNTVLPEASSGDRERGQKPEDPDARKPKPPAEPKGFAEFYAEYPKKVDRAGAANKFATITRNGIALEALMLGARRYAQYCRMKQTEQRFIKSPLVWLNKGCWNDELEGLPPLTPVQETPKPQISDEEAFRRMLAAYLKNGFVWPWISRTEPPGHPECRIPMEILEQFREQLPPEVVRKIWPVVGA